MGKKFDFGGWATVNNLKCSDGRTILHDAFAEQDGETVPLIWNHKHGEVSHVLGHALLENRDKGVYAYCSFNDSEAGKNAKLLVEHGDVTSLSIYANQLQQRGSEVVHGMIREVSLVLAGANPGAKIENVVLAHSDMVLDDQAYIAMYQDIEFNGELSHADDSEKEEPEKEKKEMAEDTAKKAPADEGEETVQDVIDSMNEKQKKVMYAMVGQALEEAKGGSKENDSEGGKEMKHNAFDTEYATESEELIHDGLQEIIKDGKRCGSLKESFLAHAEDYGIDNIDWLFPDNKNLTNTPGFVKRNPDEWVSIVMNGVHHTPFSRIKMMFADLREDEARAKGYLKGKLKKEEVFGLLRRTVNPTTIYKKQKLDRDDIIDITDFDVVSWLKGEMRMMLDEEIARAILFGDGRSSLSEDKIDEACIIPICKDADFYAIKKEVDPATGESLEHAFVTAAVTGQDRYEGSGNTKLFMANTMLTKLLLMEDTLGHRMYKTVAEVALALNVNQIVKVPASIIPDNIYGVIVDLNDYNVGADKGGSVNMFEDFDIDYNQEKYLIETRCSGALTKPFSAVVLTVASN